MTDPDRLLSPKQAAEHYGVTRVTIYRWIASGHLPAVKIGGIVRIRIVEPAHAAARAIPSRVPEHDTKPRRAEKAGRSEKARRSEKRKRR